MCTVEKQEKENHMDLHINTCQTVSPFMSLLYFQSLLALIRALKAVSAVPETTATF